MGFGSYDESEQENQQLDSDLDEDTVDGGEADHDGDVEFEIGASNDELLDKLEEIKD
ncbi:death domain-associated protein [Halobacteriales archaeon QS_6_71_20]|nr:MAG: death domain-associated protein [Halobacteriales archaeon QS_6_71_20]